MTTLYYIHDPMCSWCWGLKSAWGKLQKSLPEDIKIEYLLGGLAKDTSETMPHPMQESIKQTWKTIQNNIPNTPFNFDFWNKTVPRRSTYPACRAVIAARLQDSNYGNTMVDAIQHAYYLDAQNPSDLNTLTNCAEKLKLDIPLFKEDMASAKTEIKLKEEISLAEELGAQGFPSLVLNYNERDYFIEINYTDHMKMKSHILSIINS